MSYRTEFPDYGILETEIVEFVESLGMHDTSWHNDTCPSFANDTHRLFVDYADVSQREYEGSYRFTLYPIDDEGELIYFVDGHQAYAESDDCCFTFDKVTS